MSTEREEAVRAVAEALDLQSGRINPEFSVVQAEVAVEAMIRLGYCKQAARAVTDSMLKSDQRSPGGTHRNQNQNQNQEDNTHG